MNKALIMLVVLVLAGCNDGTTISTEGVKPPSEPWRDAVTDYQCTDAQQKRVESDTLFCKQNTSYFSSFCYGSAIMRNCTPKVNK